jgi:Tol biopolymer transport system component
MALAAGIRLGTFEITGALELCLQKDPNKRIRDIGDVRLALDGSFANRFHATPIAGRSSRLAWTLLAIAGLAIVALAVPVVMNLREQPASSAEVRLKLTVPYSREPLHFALSPDGEHLVFVASGDGAQRLWHRPLAEVTARPLDGTEGAEYPFWSPDSREIGFFAAGELRRISLAGGPPQKVADAATGRGGTWSRDGTILFAPANASALFVVAAAGGTPEVVTTQESSTLSHRFPQFLPDGRRFLFYAQGSPQARGIYLGSLDDTRATRLTPAEAAGAYAEPGLVAYVVQNALVVRRLDVARGTLTGDLVTVADRVDFDTGFNTVGFSVSAAGRLAYLAGGLERRQLTWFDRDGTMLGVASESDAKGLMLPAFSPPDERRIAVVRTDQSNQDIWVMDSLRGGGVTRITTNLATENSPVWSPDASRIAFSSNRNGIIDLFVRSSSGAGTEELLYESPVAKIITQWSRDGQFLLYQYGDPQNGWDLAALPMMGEREPIVLVSGPFAERGGQVSPDGRWLAYQSDESGSRFEIYVQPFPEGGDKLQVSTGGGSDPLWGPEGEELFFLAPDGTLMAADVQASDAVFDAGSPAALFRTRMAVGGVANLAPQYAVSSDGRFLINALSETAGAEPIIVIVNWNPGIEP